MTPKLAIRQDKIVNKEKRQNDLKNVETSEKVRWESLQRQSRFVKSLTDSYLATNLSHYRLKPIIPDIDEPQVGNAEATENYRIYQGVYILLLFLPLLGGCTRAVGAVVENTCILIASEAQRRSSPPSACHVTRLRAGYGEVYC